MANPRVRPIGLFPGLIQQREEDSNLRLSGHAAGGEVLIEPIHTNYSSLITIPTA